MKMLKIPKFGSEIEQLPLKLTDQPLRVQYFNQGVRAGFPSPADDFREAALSLDEHYLHKPENTFLVRVIGESMKPTLQKNDILIVRSDIELHDNTIGIVSVDECEFMVKRYDKQHNRFMADNPDFPTIDIKDSSTIMCLGVVRHIIRDM